MLISSWVNSYDIGSPAEVLIPHSERSSYHINVSDSRQNSACFGCSDRILMFIQNWWRIFLSGDLKIHKSQGK